MTKRAISDKKGTLAKRKHAEENKKAKKREKKGKIRDKKLESIENFAYFAASKLWNNTSINNVLSTFVNDTIIINEKIKPY